MTADSVTDAVHTEPMDEHPWTGLSQDDLDEAYPLASECANLGHLFIYSRECICGFYYLARDGKRRPMPDWSDYMDPPEIDPREYL